MDSFDDSERVQRKRQEAEEAAEKEKRELLEEKKKQEVIKSAQADSEPATQRYELHFIDKANVHAPPDFATSSASSLMRRSCTPSASLIWTRTST